jgi:hypothetical protein
LVNIEPVGSSEKRDQNKHTPILEELQDFPSLTLPVGVLVKRYLRTIRTDDLGRRKKSEGQERTNSHDDHESNIGGGLDSSFGILPIITKRNSSTKSSTTMKSNIV